MSHSQKPAEETAGVLIAVEDAHLDRLQELAAELKAAGMSIDRVSEVTGTITGSVSPARMAGLRRVRGVSAVEPEQVVRIPPPDADVQ